MVSLQEELRLGLCSADEVAGIPAVNLAALIENWHPAVAFHSSAEHSSLPLGPPSQDLLSAVRYAREKGPVLAFYPSSGLSQYCSH